MATVLLIAVG